MRFINILHIISGGGVGGIEKMILEYIQQSKHNNMVAILWNGGIISEEMIRLKINVEVFNTTPKWYYKNFKKLLQICDLEKIDVAIFHQSAPLSHLYLLGLQRKFKTVKILAYAHCNANSMLFKNKIKNVITTPIRKKAFKASDNVIAISKSVKESLIDIFKTPSDKINVIYNGVNIKSFATNIHQPNSLVEIVYVGRLIEDKGVQVILKGLYLLPKGIEYNFKIVGDGPYRTHLEDLTKQYNLQEKVEFLGSRRDVPQLLSDSDIFVHLPILEEGFGITIVEAMAAGLVCICANSGAIPEIINNEQNGFIVEKENANEFSSKLQEVIRNINAQQISQIRTQAIEDSNIYSIEKFADKLDALI